MVSYFLGIDIGVRIASRKTSVKVTSILRLGKKDSFFGLQDKKIMQLS